METNQYTVDEDRYFTQPLSLVLYGKTEKRFRDSMTIAGIYISWLRRVINSYRKNRNEDVEDRKVRRLRFQCNLTGLQL